jgi:hypothetical protein
MRKHTLVGVIILVLIAVMPGIPHGVTAMQGTTSDPIHLVLSVESDGDVTINRIDWNVNGLSPVYPGTGVRGSDYLNLSGRSTLSVLCTDLQLIDQRNSEAPRCNTYPSITAFFYADDPTWTPSSGAPTVVVTDPPTIPPEVTTDLGAFNLQTLSGDQQAQVSQVTNTIMSLGVDTAAQAVALSSYYTSQEMYFDAIGVMTSLPDLQCTAQRPKVQAPEGGKRPLLQSPVVYLRLGELFQMIGQIQDAQRYYQCAQELSDGLSDTADSALAYARLANVWPDPGQAIQFYQTSINLYVQLGATDYANSLLEICGSRNCTMP